MATEIAKLFATVGAETSDFDRKMSQVSERAKSTGGILGSDLFKGINLAQVALTGLAAVGIPTSIAGLVALGKRAIATVGEMQQLNAQVSMLSGAFEQLAGTDASEMLETLRTASHGMISDYDLMLSANRAVVLGVASNSQDLSKLMEVAMARGQAMGLSTTQAFNDIITGLGRNSPMILDNLGIVIDAEKAYKDYATAIGMASDELTKNQQIQALTKAVVETPIGVSAAMPAGTQTTAALEAAKANEKAADAAAFATSAVGEALSAHRQYSAQVTQTAADWANAKVQIREYRDEVEALHEAGYLSAEDLEMSTRVLKEGQLALGIGIPALTDDIMEAVDSWMELSGALADAHAAKAQADAQKALQDELSGAAAEAEHLAYVLGLLHDKEVEVKVNLNYKQRTARMRADVAATARYQGLASEYLLNPEIYGPPPREDEAYGYGGGSPGTRLSNAQQVARIMDEMQTSLQTGASAQSAAMGAMQASAESMAREFESFVSGLLQPTRVTAQDIMATQAGMYGTAAYPEKWDEAVRQFRMAEKGHTPWETYQYEQEFYGGQRLGEVNWEGLLAAGKQQQQYKAGQQLLLQTAMGKFAEAGIGMQKEEVAQLLGVPQDYQEVGADRGADLLAGMQSANVGGQLSESVTQQMRAKRESWIEAGRDVAGLFIQGFQEGSQPELVQSLVDAILPDVLEVVRR